MLQVKVKNKKQKKEDKGIALSEIIILILGVFAFTYLFSNNLKFVSADAVIPANEDHGSVNENVPSSIPLPSAGGGAPVAELAAAEAPLNAVAKEEAAKKTLEILGNVAGMIFETAAVAVGLYFAGGYLASLIWPDDPELQNQLGWALAGGYLGGQLAAGIVALAGWDSLSFLTAGVGIFGPALLSVGGLIGIAIGIIIFFIFAKDEKIVAVSYTCQDWQAPLGNKKDCEKCNTGKFPCDAYKCKSLGAGCELVNNEGTKEYQKCIFSNPSDSIAPVIKAWDGALKENYSYVDKTANGVKIKYNGIGADENGCVPYYTMFKYGVSLDEEAKCRYDVEDKKYEDMPNIASKELGGDYYLKNHTLLTYYTSFNVSGNTSNSTGTEFQNGGYFDTYVKCQDHNGNTNNVPFVFRYCVQTKPDRDAPVIVEELLEPLNNFPIPKDQTSRTVNVYTNKPASCKWSKDNKDASLMENDMNCNYQTPLTSNGKIVFKCAANLTGLQNGVLNTFYFNCKSYPGNEEKDRFQMSSNYEYKLKGTQELVIQSVSPKNYTTIKGNAMNVNVSLGATTILGYEDGKAVCFYKESSKPETRYIPFLDTDSRVHSQVIWLQAGDYSYDIRCIDLAGNYDKKTVTFKVDSDISSPIVIRIYNENGKLRIVTNEQASCVYDIKDCDYDIEDGNPLTTTNGKEHYLDYSSAGSETSYYIKCKDIYGNYPLASQCSVIAKPISI